MPQTVPYSPDTYAVYADNFDLSLLSMDDDNTLRLQSQSFLSSAIDYLPSTLFNDIPTIKIEKQNWIESASDINASTSADSTQSQQQELTTNLLQTIDQQSYQQFYAAATSPPHQTYDQPFLTIFPPSPTPSIELTSTPSPPTTQTNLPPLTINFQIKQEYIGLYPPSPPDSNGAPSPRSTCDIKSEPDTDDTAEASIDIDSLLQNSFEAFEPINNNSSGSSNNCSSTKQEQQQQDHQLLREYLLDTSFQRKHNLKPLELESLFGGWGSRGDIEPVISLALEHAKRDVQQTCAKLNISSGKFY